MVGGKTRIFAILGSPVAHSLSPVMQNAAFRVLGLVDGCGPALADMTEEPESPDGAADEIILSHGRCSKLLGEGTPSKPNRLDRAPSDGVTYPTAWW